MIEFNLIERLTNVNNLKFIDFMNIIHFFNI